MNISESIGGIPSCCLNGTTQGWTLLMFNGGFFCKYVTVYECSLLANPRESTSQCKKMYGFGWFDLIWRYLTPEMNAKKNKLYQTIFDLVDNSNVCFNVFHPYFGCWSFWWCLRGQISAKKHSQNTPFKTGVETPMVSGECPRDQGSSWWS